MNDFDLIWYDSIDSTNNELKRRLPDAPDGLAIAAMHQSAGRGRFGRTFDSPAGKGLYLSILLGSGGTSSFTAMAAVAAADAVEEAAGIRPGIKWPNDLVIGRRKLCGILCELCGGRRIVGVGINVLQTEADFAPEIREKAISLKQALSADIDIRGLAPILCRDLMVMEKSLPEEKALCLEKYRRDCITIGKEVSVRFSGSDAPISGTAEGVDEDYRLIFRTSDGELKLLDGGEVSVFGFY